MLIDAVYKLGVKSQWGHYEELRYSLRSLEKNFTSLRNVFIVGVLPQWCNNIIHIPAEDPYKSNKDANLINKLILACGDDRLSDMFINMSDDYYFFKETGVDDLQVPLIWNNPFLELTKKTKDKLNKWERRAIKSIEVLKENGFKHDLYESHTPTLINKKEYPNALLRYNFGFGDGMLGNTLYYNTIKKQGRSINSDDIMRLSKIIETGVISRFVNVNNTPTEDEKEYLKNKFKDVSRFEKN